MIQVQILVGELHIGQPRSPTEQVFANNSRLKKKLQTLPWSHCDCLVKTHRLICKITYSGQHLTSRDLDLMPNIDLTFQGHQVHFSTRLIERNSMVLELSR